MAETRIEKDTMGEIAVPSDRYWGAQTQRSLKIFRRGRDGTRCRESSSRLSASLKKPQPWRTSSSGFWTRKGRSDRAGRRRGHRRQARRPVPAGRLADGQRHADQHERQRGDRQPRHRDARRRDAASKKPIHPNDDVNKAQSSNDTFPTAMHIAAVEASCDHLLPERSGSCATRSAEKARPSTTSSRSAAPTCRTRRRSRWVRSSRGYVAQLDHGLRARRGWRCPTCASSRWAAPRSARGSTPTPSTRERVAQDRGADRPALRHRARTSSRRWPATTRWCIAHGALKTLAASLMKIANDVRWLASGPALRHRRDHHPRERARQLDHAGQGQPDPVRGDDHGLRPGDGQRRGGRTSAARSGNFELNVFKPVIIHNFLHRARGCSATACESFREHCAVGIEPNRARIEENLRRLADAGHRAQPAHRLRQRGEDRQEGARRARPSRRRGRARPGHRRAVRPVGPARGDDHSGEEVIMTQASFVSKFPGTILVFAAALLVGCTPLPCRIHTPRLRPGHSFSMSPISRASRWPRLAFSARPVSRASTRLCHTRSTRRSRKRLRPSGELRPMRRSTCSINKALGAEYSTLIASFGRGGILEREPLQRIGSALSSRYVLLPGLAEFNQVIIDRLSIYGWNIIQSRVTTLRLWLQLWETQTGKILWESSGEVTLATKLLRSEQTVPLDEIAQKLWLRMIQDNLLDGDSRSRFIFSN